MKVSYSGASAVTKKCDALIIPVFAGKNPLGDYEYGDQVAGQFVSGTLSGDAGTLAIGAAPDGLKVKSVIAIGLGDRNDFSMTVLRNAVSAALRHATLVETKAKSAAIDLSVVAEAVGGKDEIVAPGGDERSSVKAAAASWVGQSAVEGAVLGAYTYTELFNNNDKKLESMHRVSSFAVHSSKGLNGAVKAGGEAAEAICRGVNLARDLCNKPNSHLRPGHLAREAQAAAKSIPGLTCKVLNKKKLEELGAGALLSVGAGSGGGDSEPRLIILEWKGGKKSDKPLCFVGKGITFDTGGYSLKPAAAMLGMKWDMGGAATMLGATVAIAGMGLPINLVTAIPTTENLVNEVATKPGDVVTSMSGITIEVNNTDAEGRLILCDALTYVQKTYSPDVVIDAATLTGAVLIGLGDQVFGIMSNDDGLAEDIAIGTKDAGELSWRLPLPDVYDKYLESDIADVSNIGGRMAGTITAGLFLQRFIEKDQKWAHLDIAGVANNEGKQGGVAPPKGGTGTAVRTLVSVARNRVRK